MSISAASIWIFAPFVVGLILLLVDNQRVLSILGGVFAITLAIAAEFIPIDQAFTLGTYSLKIDSTFEIFGRVLAIPSERATLLALVYTGAGLWFFGSEAAKSALRLVPLGLMITALMIAAIAVQPFLFAALFIQMAVLLAIPLTTNLYHAPGKGVIRFLIYQTLGMPFILLAGWLLAGVEASPGDLALASQSAAVLMLGFAFLLAIFPLYNWIPMLAEDTHPFTVGFLLWIMPTITIIFATGFLDRYSWLRASPQILLAFRTSGLIMVVTGGIWAAFQRHLGRMMAYGSIAETGFSLLALSIDPRFGVPVLFLLIPARTLTLALWSLALTVIYENAESMRFRDARGTLRSTPFAGAGVLLSTLSISAFPLLAGFPARLALWESLARASFTSAVWLGVGTVGLMIGAIRSMAVLSMADEFSEWKPRESWVQMIMLGLGMIGLFILGIFPEVANIFLADLPLMFEHLGR